MPIEISLVDSVTKISSKFKGSYESNALALGVLNTWNDLSGNGNNMIATNILTDIPTVVQDAQGYRAVNFPQVEGFERFQSLQAFAQPADITVCTALDIQELSKEQAICGQYVSDNIYLAVNQILIQPTPNEYNYQPIGILTTGKQVWVYRRKGKSYQFFVNNVLKVSGTFTENLTPTLTSYMIGRTGAGYSPVGNIYQHHICFEYLNDGKMSQLARYSAFKAGIKI